MKKTIKEIIIILSISSGIGLIINFLNPAGIPLIGDESRYKIDSTKNKSEYDNLKNFRNDPYDTSRNSDTTVRTFRERTKEGIVKPLNIGLEQAKKLYDMNALFVDGRNEDEYKAGSIKGAISIPYTYITSLMHYQKKDLLRKFNKHGIVVVYCGGGNCEVSIDLAYELARYGFTSTNIYIGGFKEWNDAGYPVEK